MVSRPETILVRGARQLLTLRGTREPRRGPAMSDLGIVQDGALLIGSGQILQAGPSRRVENLKEARGAREINAAGRIVMPGFVDSHTHLAFLPGDARAFRSMPGRRLEARARNLIQSVVRHGTTTIEIKSGSGLDETGELKTLRVLSRLHRDPIDVLATYFGANAVPGEAEESADTYLGWMESRMLPLIRLRRRASFVDVRCEAGVFDVRQARAYLERARSLGFGLKVHAEQFSRTGGARLAAELNAVSADHLVFATDEDVRLLAASSTIATLIPAAVFHLRQDRYAPARALIDAGAAVSLATGFHPEHSPTWSMPMAAALACRYMAMTPAEAICAGTFNAAHAVGRAATAGSLEPGKPADFLLMDVADYRELPHYFGVNNVHMTVKGGQVI